jgi:hypothetical protein
MHGDEVRGRIPFKIEPPTEQQRKFAEWFDVEYAKALGKALVHLAKKTQGATILPFRRKAD